MNCDPRCNVYSEFQLSLVFKIQVNFKIQAVRIAYLRGQQKFQGAHPRRIQKAIVDRTGDQIASSLFSQSRCQPVLSPIAKYGIGTIWGNFIAKNLKGSSLRRILELSTVIRNDLAYLLADSMLCADLRGRLKPPATEAFIQKIYEG